MNSKELLLWNQTQNKLKSFVHRLVKDRAQTEDIIQDIFLKVNSRVGQLKEPEKMVSWIYQIARNAVTDYFRKKNKPVQFHDIGWDVEEQPLNDCVSSCLEEMMTTLPETYRHALEMTEHKNLSQLELAKELKISYSGAKSRVQRARQMLKEKMNATYRLEFDRYGNALVCEDRGPCTCPERPA